MPNRALIEKWPWLLASIAGLLYAKHLIKFH